MSNQVLQATIRAYDEFTQQFQKYQTELKKTDQTQKQTAQGTEQLNRTTSTFFQTIGNLGALYAFQRGLREVMSTGREFELEIKKSQAVVNDMSSALRDASMTSQGIYGPTELAKSFYELGSAGLSAQETIKATPDILDFATAGLLKMDDAAYAVTSTVKSFGLEWSQTGEVVDAFTQAMNSTALKAEDFKWAMSSAGAVGKMAGQDFREVVGAVAAMRDAGVQAQDAGTSVKAALLQLINPTKEAKDLMDELGISVYDASGHMKQWHEIIAELEVALGPYNEQSRNMILTTIAGSDGVRAMATGLNMGSERLAEYVVQMGSAEGATKKMAGVMEDSFDGAMRKANANLEKTKILLFEDLSKGAAGFLGAINSLITGFNSLDEGGRRAIEMIVGGAGLVIALTVLANAAKAAGLAIQGMWVKMGPIGWAILGISALITGIMGYKQAQGAATEAQQKANEKLTEYNKLIRDGVPKEKIASVKEETAKIQELVKEYDRLIAVKKEESGKTTLGTGGNLTGTTEAYKEAESGIRKINDELAKYGLNADTARQKVEQLNQRVAEAAALDYAAAVEQANKSVKTKQATDATVALIKEYQSLTANVKTEA
ncbi:MAG: phage tail tape measure protein, partial [Dehalococcoidales bacterium]